VRPRRPGQRPGHGQRRRQEFLAALELEIVDHVDEEQDDAGLVM
jgi:hypothetical protein